MKITVKRVQLIATLMDILKIVPGRSSLPIIGTALFSAKDGSLSIVSTDLITFLVERTKARIAKTGAFCVSPKVLLTFLKAVDSELIVMSTATNTVRVEAGKASTLLPTMDAKEFPALPKRINAVPAVVSSLSEALEAVSYAMAKDETRPVLAGAYLDGKAGIITAADGFRLATSALQVRGEGKLPSAILDHAAVFAIKALFTGKVYIAGRVIKTKDHTNAYVQFEQSDRLLVTMAVSGNFPQYNQLIPKGGTIVRFDRDEMKAAVKLMLIANPMNYLTRLITKGRNLTVFTILDGNRTEMAVAAKGKTKIAFDARYLRDALNNLPQGEVIMRTTTPGSPAVFRANGNTHILMPMFCAETTPPKAESITPAATSSIPAPAAVDAVKQAEEIVSQAKEAVAV